MSYSDSDSMTDYAHGYSANLRNTIEAVREKGGEVIRVYGNSDDPAVLSRAKKIVKGTGNYILNMTTRHVVYENCGIVKEYDEPEIELIRIGESD